SMGMLQTPQGRRCLYSSMRIADAVPLTDFTKLAVSTGPGRTRVGILELKPQDALCIGPVILGSGQRYPDRLGDLRHGQTGEKSQVDNGRGRGISLFELGKSFVESQQVKLGSWNGRFNICEVDALPLPACFLAGLVSCLLYQDAAHGFGGGGKEVAATIPEI